MDSTHLRKGANRYFTGCNSPSQDNFQPVKQYNLLIRECDTLFVVRYPSKSTKNFVNILVYYCLRKLLLNLKHDHTVD